MTLSDIMSPFTTLVKWLQSYTFYIGEYPLTFWDLIIWEMLAVVFFAFLKKMMDDE